MKLVTHTVAGAASRHPLAELRLRPLTLPGEVLRSSVNRGGHAGDPQCGDARQALLAKLPPFIAGHEDPVARHSRVTHTHDEVEVAVGRSLRQASGPGVVPATFGCTRLNDLLARGVRLKDAQIILGRDLAGCGPIGPCIVTADELPDPGDVHRTTRANGQTLQDGSTSDWPFPSPRLVLLRA